MPKVRHFATRTIPNVPLVFENEERERVTEKFTLVYKSYSTNALNELTALETSPDGTVPYAAYLEKMVVSINDADGEPIATTLNREFFDSLALRENAKALFDAIGSDINPQMSSPAPGLVTSEPAASAV